MTEPRAHRALLTAVLDSWAGLGAVIDGMVRQGFDVALTRNGDTGWRALFFPSSFLHESKAGSAWGQDAVGCGGGRGVADLEAYGEVKP